MVTACKQTLELETTRVDVLDYIESRMNILAPNLTAVVSSKVSIYLILCIRASIDFCVFVRIGAFLVQKRTGSRHHYVSRT